MSRYILFILIIFTIINNCTDHTNGQQFDIPSSVKTEFEFLNIVVYSFVRYVEDTIPDNFAKLPWLYDSIVCEDGGYNITRYKNEAVKFLGYNSNKHWRNEPLNVWAITNEDTCICVYFSVREGSSMAPGIFSVNDSLISK